MNTDETTCFKKVTRSEKLAQKGEKGIQIHIAEATCLKRQHGYNKQSLLGAQVIYIGGQTYFIKLALL